MSDEFTEQPMRFLEPPANDEGCLSISTPIRLPKLDPPRCRKKSKSKSGTERGKKVIPDDR